jgi:hypothetical protein
VLVCERICGTYIRHNILNLGHIHVIDDKLARVFCCMLRLACVLYVYVSYYAHSRWPLFICLVHFQITYIHTHTHTNTYSTSVDHLCEDFSLLQLSLAICVCWYGYMHVCAGLCKYACMLAHIDTCAERNFYLLIHTDTATATDIDMRIQ